MSQDRTQRRQAAIAAVLETDTRILVRSRAYERLERIRDELGLASVSAALDYLLRHSHLFQ